MDRPMRRMDAETFNGMDSRPGPFLPPSRSMVVDLCLEAMGRGPVLVTGDAGIGKTWLMDTIAHRSSGNVVASWVTIDLTPNDGPAELYRHLGRKLGLAAPSRGESHDRIEIADALLDRQSDVEKIGLILDESHNYSMSVWEEVRILANRMGDLDGFAWIFILGQTQVVRKFATRPFAALESRLSAHAHLRPLTVDESIACVTSRYPSLDWSSIDPEVLHRDACGNPARMLRKASSLPSTSSAPIAEKRPVFAPKATEAPSAEASVIEPRPSQVPPTLAGGLMGPDRPPLHFEDNAIEVGWSEESSPANEDDGVAGEDRSDGISRSDSARSEVGEQAVNDHYAALQAWREWAENQTRQAADGGRTSASSVPDRDRLAADAIDDAGDEDSEGLDSLDPARPIVRAEGHQKFAPFGQLFPRMSQVRQAD